MSHGVRPLVSLSLSMHSSFPFVSSFCDSIAAARSTKAYCTLPARLSEKPAMVPATFSP